MHQSLAVVAATVAVSLLFCVGFSFLASSIFFVFRHSRGTLLYFVKTIIILLIAVPLCILLMMGVFCSAIFLMARIAKRGWDHIFKKSVPAKSEDLSVSRHDVVVHLIHGTFEPNAAWTYQGSPMWNAIQQRNPKATLTRFEWTGANTHAGRKTAAEELGKALLRSESNHHYIVAHSHAGNVVLALSQLFPNVAMKIKGVCLLSTPFIFKKNLLRSGGPLTFLHSIGFAIFMEVIFSLALWPLGFYHAITAIVVFFVSLMLDLILSRRFGAELTKEIGEEEAQVDFRNVQIMHSIGDEADSGLRIVSTLHEVCFGIFSQLAQANKLLNKTIDSAYFICYFLQALAVAGVYAFVHNPKFWLICVFASFVGVVIAHLFDRRYGSKEMSMVLIMASLPVGIVAFYLNAVKAIAYGDWRLLFCPNVFIYTSETPEGDHSVLKYAPTSDDGLVHSTHSHEGAIRDVAEWIWYETSGQHVS